MNCLFVIDSLGSGGAQRQMVTLARAFSGRGHAVRIFVYYPQYDHLLPDVEERGIPVTSVRKQSRLSPRVVVALGQLLRRTKYDVVLSYLSTPNVYAELASIVSRQTPLVVSERSAFIRRRASLWEYVRHQAHRLADAVVINSHHHRDAVAHRFPWLVPKLRVITNGIDLKRFSPIGDAAVCLGNRPIELLSIGNVTENKNVIGLIKALDVLRSAYGLEVHVRWAGKRSRTVAGTRLFDRATALLRQLQLADNWEWLGVRADVPALLRAHDALVHPSFYEGMPNVVCEALACGRPVLASAVCDHARLVQNGKTGFLFNPSSPEDIARCIHHFATLSVHTRAGMGKAARAFAEFTMSEERFVDAYETLFEELCASNRAT